MKLSVIIALYNNEQYIAKAILSVIDSNLKLSEYEIIVINDGSTDGGQKVVEDLKMKYNNIVLVNKTNGGQSSARNVGFQIAAGDYILCLDSDDYIDSNILKSELNFVVENNLDLYAYSFLLRTNNCFKVKNQYPEILKPISGERLMSEYTISGAMCGYFYKKNIIQKYDLHLIEGVFLEDEEFVLKFIAYSKKIMCRQSHLYIYRQHDQSTTNFKSQSHRVRLIGDLVTITIAIKRFSNTRGLTNKTISGIQKKREQLTTSIILNFFRFRIDSGVVSDILAEMQFNGLYPNKISHSSLKFKICSIFFNNEKLLIFLHKIYLKWRS